MLFLTYTDKSFLEVLDLTSVGPLRKRRHVWHDNQDNPGRSQLPLLGKDMASILHIGVMAHLQVRSTLQQQSEHTESIRTIRSNMYF